MHKIHIVPFRIAVETITKKYSQHWWHDTFDQKKASELMGHSHIVLGFKFDEKKKRSTE